MLTQNLKSKLAAIHSFDFMQSGFFKTGYRLKNIAHLLFFAVIWAIACFYLPYASIALTPLCLIAAYFGLFRPVLCSFCFVGLQISMMFEGQGLSSVFEFLDVQFSVCLLNLTVVWISQTKREPRKLLVIKTLIAFFVVARISWVLFSDSHLMSEISSALVLTGLGGYLLFNYGSLKINLERKLHKVLQNLNELEMVMSLSDKIIQFHDVTGTVLSVVSTIKELLSPAIIAYQAKLKLNEATCAYAGQLRTVLAEVCDTGRMQSMLVSFLGDKNTNLIRVNVYPYASHSCMVVLKDVTQEEADSVLRAKKQKEAALVLEVFSSNAKILDDVSRDSGVAISLRDKFGEILYRSESFQSIFGVSDHTTFLSEVPPLFIEGQYVSAIDLVGKYVSQEFTGPIKFAYPFLKDGLHPVLIETEIKTIATSLNDFNILVISKDITELKEQEVQLQTSNVLVSHITEALLLCDMSGLIIGVNPAFTELTGYTEAEALGRFESELMSTQFVSPSVLKARDIALKTKGHWEGKLHSRKKNGDSFLEKRTVTLILDKAGKPLFSINLITNLSPAQQQEELIWRLATHESITGLPGRALAVEMFEGACLRATKLKSKVATIFLQFPRYRALRESLGTAQGDKLLKAMADRLATHAEEFDFIAVGKNNLFSFLIEDAGDREKISQAVQLLHNLFEMPLLVEQDPYYMQVNMGIALFPDDGYNGELVSRHALTALREAATVGPGAYRFYSETIPQLAQANLKLENAFRTALNDESIPLEYFPVYASSNNEVVRFEVQSHWDSIEFGQIPMTKLAEIAEISGLSTKWGNYLLRGSVSQLVAWSVLSRKQVPITVPVLAQQFKDSYWVPSFLATLKEFNVSPSLINVEISEITAMQNIELTLSVLEQLKKAGVQSTLSKFGLGSLNLAHLSKLPLTVVKLDSSFMQEVGTKEGDALLLALVRLLHGFGFKIIAEGLEANSQVMTLRKLGCEAYSGPAEKGGLNTNQALALLSGNHLTV